MRPPPAGLLRGRKTLRTGTLAPVTVSRTSKVPPAPASVSSGLLNRKRTAYFDSARAVVESLCEPAMAGIDPAAPGKDPKTALQEILQGRHLPLPRYALLATRGEAHAQEFEIECLVPELGIRSTGVGGSRRIAEQQAAQRAIAAIKQ